jgi:hypothetical protein
MLLLLIVLMGIVGSALAQRPYILFDGHVLCRLGNGKAEVPVKNAEVTLMEEDRSLFP